MKIMQTTFATLLLLSNVRVSLFQDLSDDSSNFDKDIQVIGSEQDAIDLEATLGDDYYNGDYDYSNGDPENDRATMKPVDSVLIAIYSIITVVGLIANAVVFFVIFAGNETGKTVTAIYILQLTVADTVFLFSLPVFSMQKVLDKWTFGEGVCTLCQTIKFMNYYAGIFFLMTMSVDRYIAVAYSTRLTQIRTKKRTYIACICMWCAAIIMSIPAMMYSKTEGHYGVVFCKVLFPGYHEPNDEDKTVTISFLASGSGDFTSEDLELEYSPEEIEEFQKPFTCDHIAQSSLYKTWLVINFVIAFVIPFLVIVVSYLKILTHLKSAEHKIHTATNKAAKTRKRVTRMVAALVVCFTVCWLPHHIFMLAKIKGFPTTVPICQSIEQFFIALAFSNSAINPLLYTFMGNNFKERFRKSVTNTQLAIRRHSSRSSTGRRKSAGSHSDNNLYGNSATMTNGKKSSLGFIVHYRKQSSNQPGYQNGQQQNQAALLGNRRDRTVSYDLSETHGNGKEFCATTSIGEQTLETKI